MSRFIGSDMHHGLRGLIVHKGSIAFSGLILACDLGLAIAMTCGLPARRATRVPPRVALDSE